MHELTRLVREHWFWSLMTAACVVWYSTITVYVAIRGSFDIKHMLARLAEKNKEDPSDPSDRSDPSY